MNNDVLAKKCKVRKSPPKNLSPKAAVKYNGTITLLHKDCKQSGHLSPLQPDQQSELLPTDSKLTKDAIRSQLDLEVTKLKDDRQQKHAAKCLSKASAQERKDACNALCRAVELVRDAVAVCQIMLLAVLARVLDLAAPDLSGSPVVRIQNVSSIPSVIRLVIRLVNGDEVHKGKDWSLCRPNCLEPYISVGAAIISQQPYHYAGGQLMLHYKEKQFWLPLQQCAFAIAPNVPKPMLDALVAPWPTSIPILCGGNYRFKDRPIISLAGDSFLTIDPAIMQELEEQAELIHAELECFFMWFRNKKHRWRACREDSKRYRPFVRCGRFVQYVDTQETAIWSLALAVLNAFLDFAVENAKWLSKDKAHQTFLDIWRLVLPESAPVDQHGVSKASMPISSDAFLAFLRSYLECHQSQIAPIGVPCEKDTVAALREIGGICYLILPRSLTFQAFLQECPDIDMDTTQINWESALQRTLMDQGIPFNTESRDISWRYNFYRKGCTPDGVKPKLPCLGLPLDKAPENVSACVDLLFGSVFGSPVGGNPPDRPSEPGSEVKSV